jgi:ATP-dependent Clp protease ATP-binding subunit ClpX
VAAQAIKRKTGARGLRAILEQAMLDIMYDIPSRANVKECIIDKDVISKIKQPEVVYLTEDEIKASQMAKTQAESA